MQGTEALTNSASSASRGLPLGGATGDVLPQDPSFGLTFLALASPVSLPTGQTGVQAGGSRPADAEVPLAKEFADPEDGSLATPSDVAWPISPLGVVAMAGQMVSAVLPEPETGAPTAVAGPSLPDACVGVLAQVSLGPLELNAPPPAAGPPQVSRPASQTDVQTTLPEPVSDSLLDAPGASARDDDGQRPAFGLPDRAAASAGLAGPVLLDPMPLHDHEIATALMPDDSSAVWPRDRAVPAAPGPLAAPQTDESRLTKAILPEPSVRTAIQIGPSPLPSPMTAPADRGLAMRLAPATDVRAAPATGRPASVFLQHGSPDHAPASPQEGNTEPVLPAAPIASSQKGTSAPIPGKRSPEIRWPGPTETALRILGEGATSQEIAAPTLRVPQKGSPPNVSAFPAEKDLAGPQTPKQPETPPLMAEGLPDQEARQTVTNMPRDALPLPEQHAEVAPPTSGPAPKGIQSVLAAEDERVFQPRTAGQANPTGQAGAFPDPPSAAAAEEARSVRSAAAEPAGPQARAEASTDQTAAPAGAEFALGPASPDGPAAPSTVSVAPFDRIEMTQDSPAWARSGPSHPVQQVATALSLNLPEQPGRIELTLTPENLGKLHFDFRPEGDSLSIILSAERPETLDLMRRHLPDLIAELRQLGLEPGNLSFGTWAEGGQGKSQMHDRGVAAPSVTEMSPAGPVADMSAPLTPYHNSGLDLRL